MKKIISLLLTIAMVISVSTAVLAADMPQQDYPQRFWDVPKDHWAFNYIAELVNKGVLAGYEDGSFKPDSTVTRAEWAKIMVLAAGLPANDNNVYFTDMNNHWANIYVNTAKDYLAAYTDGTFKPDQAAVREDVTVSMVKLKGYDVSNVDYSYLSQFTDVNSISNSLKAYVAVAVEKDLISGFDDGTFRGQNTLTRAEAATLLWRAFQYGNDNKVVDTPDTPVTTPPATTVTTPPTTTTPPTQTTKEPQQTPDNTAETPEPTEKPYIIDTLVKTDISSPLLYTKNNDDIYYVEDNNIYQINIGTSEKRTIINNSDFIVDNEQMTLANFEITSIIYDYSKDRILVTGKYNEVNPTNAIENPVILAIENGNINILKEDWEMYADSELLVGVLSNGDIVTLDGYTYDSELFKRKSSIVPYTAFGYYMNDRPIQSLIGSNDVIYSLSDGIISKYDYASASPVCYNFDERILGVYNNGFIGMNGDEINIYNFNGKCIKNIAVGDIAVKDSQPIIFSKILTGIEIQISRYENKLYHRLYITNDENIIFYDSTAKAFRIISEN